MDKKKYFLEILRKAEKRYGGSAKRLAAEEWREDWQVLIATILSAQSRDETTIPIAERLFEEFSDLKSLSMATYSEVFKILRSINYNKTKAKNVLACAKMLVSDFHGKIPDKIEELVKLPGVGRKTANLVLTEVHEKEGICVDTHVHRLSNVLGLVKTKTPHQTEIGLMKIAPRKHWSRINRLFVLWGKEVPGRDKKRLLNSLN